VLPTSIELDRSGISLEHSRIQTIVSVLELNDVSNRVPDRIIIPSGEILESLATKTKTKRRETRQFRSFLSPLPSFPPRREETHLHESTSHVTRLGGLDSGIDETFSSRHGVSEELGGCETGEEGVSNESFGGRFSRLLLEVRKKSILESIDDSRTGDNLLSDDGDHLGDVNLGTWERRKTRRGRSAKELVSLSPLSKKQERELTLGTTSSHDERSVVSTELGHTDLSTGCSNG